MEAYIHKTKEKDFDWFVEIVPQAAVKCNRTLIKATFCILLIEYSNVRFYVSEAHM